MMNWRGPVGTPYGEPPEETTRIRPPGMPGAQQPNFKAYSEMLAPHGLTPFTGQKPGMPGGMPGPTGPPSIGPYDPGTYGAPTGNPNVGGGVQMPAFNGPQGGGPGGGGGPPPAVSPPPPPGMPPQSGPPGSPPPMSASNQAYVDAYQQFLQPPPPPQPQQPQGLAQINTSITPQNIYTPQQTQETINTTRAIAAQNANLPWLLRQYARPGVSQRSPSALGQAIPQIAQAQSAIARAPTELSFADDLANMDHYRAGQVSREQEAQGMGGGLLRMQDIGRNLQSTQANLLAQLLGRFG